MPYTQKSIDEIERVKVRRNSQLKGTEHNFWQSVGGGNKRNARRILARTLKAARNYTLRNKAKGRRHGGIGYVGIEILEFMTKIVDYKSGRLEPSYKYLAEKLRRSVDAISRGLKQLRAHGFLDWKRRFVRMIDVHGRPIEVQTSNAYRIILTHPAIKQLGLPFQSVPLPLDEEHRKAALEANRQRQLDALKYGEQEKFMFDSSDGLRAQFIKMGKLVQLKNDSSDSAIRSET